MSFGSCRQGLWFDWTGRWGWKAQGFSINSHKEIDKDDFIYPVFTFNFSFFRGGLTPVLSSAKVSNTSLGVCYTQNSLGVSIGVSTSGGSTALVALLFGGSTVAQLGILL